MVLVRLDNNLQHNIQSLRLYWPERAALTKMRVHTHTHTHQTWKHGSISVYVLDVQLCMPRSSLHKYRATTCCLQMKMHLITSATALVASTGKLKQTNQNKTFVVHGMPSTHHIPRNYGVESYSYPFHYCTHMQAR